MNSVASAIFPRCFARFLYFDISFMVWVLLGSHGNSIAAQFALSPGQKGFLVAVPLLGGAVLRLVLGVMTDRWGAAAHRVNRPHVDAHSVGARMGLGR